MRKRHAARVQRPHGQNPHAIRRDTADTHAHEDTHAHAPMPGPCSNAGPAHSRDQMSEDMLARRLSDLRPAEARR